MSKNMEISQTKASGLLNKVMDALIEERLFKVAFQETRETTKYDKWLEESISLGLNIKAKLGSDRILFMKHEEFSALCESALLKDAYKRGFLDGIELKYEVL